MSAPSRQSIDDRRERVAELYGKRDRRIAELLIDEGYFGTLPRMADERRRFVLTAKRTVCNDRAAIRAEAAKKRKDLAGEFIDITSADYILRMRSRINDAEDILDDPKARPTAKVQALSEMRLLEEAIAKSQGVDVADRGASEDDAPQVPFLGLVVDLRNVSEAALKQGEKLKSPLAATPEKKPNATPRKKRRK